MARTPRFAALSLVALWALTSAAAEAPSEDARRKQEILFPEVPEHSALDAAFDIPVSATSKLAVSLELVSGPAVLDGTKVRLTGVPGLVVLRASQAGNAVFLPAVPAERAFSVLPPPSPPVITSQPELGAGPPGSAVLISVKAAGVPPPSFQWRRDGTPIPGANAGVVSVDLAGIYDVVVSNPSGSVTSRPVRVAGGRRSQTINFQAPGTQFTVGQSVTLNASATSGLPVRLEVASGPAYLVGNSLTATGSGPVVVRATQDGDSTYEAAASATQTITFNSSALPGQLVRP